MIDRSYLPLLISKRVPGYKDAKMDGFSYLNSASAPPDDTNKVTYIVHLITRVANYYLSQVYAGSYTRIRDEKQACFTLNNKYQVSTKDFILIKTTTGSHQFEIKKTLLVLNLSRRCSMNQLEFQRNHLQMDYYSESYQD